MGILEMDFERILGVTFFISSSHSIMLCIACAWEYQAVAIYHVLCWSVSKQTFHVSWSYLEAYLKCFEGTARFGFYMSTIPLSPYFLDFNLGQVLKVLRC